MLGVRRVQEESNRRQQLLAQNNKLLQSLRVELRVYEKLDVELRVPKGTGAWAEAFLSQTGSALFPERLPPLPTLTWVE